MKRALLILAAAALLAAAVPASVFAERATKYLDHSVIIYCDAELDGGYVDAFVKSSQTSGDLVSVEIWLGDAIPFEDDPTVFGSSDAVDVDEGEPVTVATNLAYVDAEGDAGSGSLEATLARFGDPIEETGIPQPGDNVVSHTTGTIQFLKGEGTLTLPGGAEAVIPCFGEIVDTRVFETNPHASVFDDREAVSIDCYWSVGDDGFAGFSATQDKFAGGFRFAYAFLRTPDLELSGYTEDLDIAATVVSGTVPLEDTFTGDPYTAEVSATITPLGDPVTSFLILADYKVKVVEQRLSVDGSIAFSSGQTFTMDTVACFANTYSEHQVITSSNGPKPHPAAPNDTPDGAIALSPGDRIQVDTTGTARDAEIPNTTCPIDAGVPDTLGYTVWYTVEGTGGELTADTAGTHFDTGMAVYVMEGGELVEIACVDDVYFEPIGTTLQAAITWPTELGVTYWIQIGGLPPHPLRNPYNFDSGRLKLSVD